MYKITRMNAIEIVEHVLDHLPLRIFHRRFQVWALMNPGSQAARIRREHPKKSKRTSFWLDRKRNGSAAACFYRYVAEVQKSSEILDFFYAAVDFLGSMWMTTEADELTDALQWRVFFVGFFSPFIIQDPEGVLLLRVGTPDQYEYRRRFGDLFADCSAYVI
eukprot:scaffold834_cov172-Amphora_coffeaeformis.AAC.8